MIVSDARPEDLAGITEIYNHAVANTTAIWNETTVDLQNRTKWHADRVSLGYPVIVALDDRGSAIGYASFGDWRAFDGYRFTVEHSVYVRNDQRGRGVGEALMRELIERARLIGKHVMVAGIESTNTGSIRLHEKLGFELVGNMREVGTKFGRWLDLSFMQLALDSLQPGAKR